MMRARVGLGLAAAAGLVAVAAPLRLCAKKLGWSAGPSASVVFNRWLCRVLRVRVHHIGAPALGPPRLIVANHVSWLDILVLGATEPMTFLAKKQIGENALGRQLALMQGIIFVDRERKRCIPSVNAEMARVMLAGDPVVLFAEATTNDGTRLLRFRSSHFEAVRLAGVRATVQPVYLHYSGVGGMPAGRLDKSALAWYGDMTFLPSLRRVMGCGGVRCDIHYGEPIVTNLALSRKALARETEQAMRRLQQRARATLPVSRIANGRQTPK